MSKKSKQSPPQPVAVKAKKVMTIEDVARIQSKFAKEHDGVVPKDSFISRAQKAVAKRKA